jgi:chemotaxis protein methyltransferase CheR
VVKLQNDEFEYIVNYVKRNYGLNLSKKRVLIECRLRKELERYGLDTFKAYLQMVEKDPTHVMADEMIHRLTTHYTYFFREPQHFEFIEKNILPELCSKPEGFQYHVWCAGCATGEECYSLAMLFEQYKEKDSHLPYYHITGTDVSKAVLTVARNGSYPDKELNGFPYYWKGKFCKQNRDGTFSIADRVRRNVSFSRLNLTEPLSMRRKYDLILCRNVMIYFDTQAKKALISNLEKCLNPGGYLMVGHSELLSRESTKLTFVSSAVYKKE